MNRFIPRNKQDAEKINNLSQSLGSIINLLKLSPEYGTDNEMLDAASSINATYKPYADAISKKYNLPSNTYNIPDPAGEFQSKVIHGIGKGITWGADKVYQGAKNSVEWGKDVKQSFPQIRENFTKKLNDDLNITRKWNDAFKKPSFGELEITTPRQKTDANNNITLYGQVEKTQPVSKYQGYKNPLTNDNRIFTREDIGSFSRNEYSDAEPAIMAQWGKIGIPTNGDLERERLNNNGTTFVQGYTRSDGIRIKPHFRAV